MMGYFRVWILRAIAFSAGGAVAYGIFHLIDIGDFWPRVGLASLCGFLVMAMIFNFMDDLLVDLARARREAEKKDKFIELVTMRIAYGAFLISLLALALSAYPYIAHAR